MYTEVNFPQAKSVQTFACHKKMCKKFAFYSSSCLPACKLNNVIANYFAHCFNLPGAISMPRSLLTNAMYAKMYKFILPGFAHYIPGHYVLYRPLKRTVGTV